MSTRPLRIGVLALQGAFREHRKALEACGAEVVEIRRPFDGNDTKFKGLGELDGIVLPGGESTTMGKLLCDWVISMDFSPTAFAAFFRSSSSATGITKT